MGGVEALEGASKTFGVGVGGAQEGARKKLGGGGR